MKTVLVIDAPEAPAVRKMFGNNNWYTTNTINKGTPDLVCFVGGEDVTPGLYGEKNTSSYNNLERDLREEDLYHEYLNIPKVGICRGGQFLNVMSGGKMIQHINGHQMCQHLIDSDDFDDFRDQIYVKGDHHQAMVPTKEAKLVAWCAHDNTPEVVWYLDTKSLCFQPHPEWGHKPTETYFFELINRYFSL